MRQQWVKVFILGILAWAVLKNPLSKAPIWLSSPDKTNSSGYLLPFIYYTAPMRIRALEEAAQAINSRYALVQVKAHHLGLKPDSQLAWARRQEKRVSQPETLFQRAQANLEFLDRMQAWGAKFQDSHLVVDELYPRPEVYIDLELREVGDKILVQVPQANVDVGDQLISIDGDPLSVVLASLEAMISSSSAHQRRAAAVRHLTARNFFYPQSLTSVWKFKKPLGKHYKVAFAWHHQPGVERKDAQFYLNSIGIRAKPKGKSEAYRYRSPSDLKNSELWLREEKNMPTIRTGELQVKGNTVSFLQIYRFGGNNLYVDQTKEVKVSWTQVIRRFVQRSKKRKRPLLVDLRHNPGGEVKLAGTLMGLLGQPGKVYPTFTEGYRLTPGIMQIWEQEELSHAPLPWVSPASKVIAEAIRSGREYTAFFRPQAPIEPDPMVGGFSQPVVVLIGPDCQSSCDLFVAMFQASERGLLVGKPTAGAGSSYLSWDHYNHAVFNDSFMLLKVRIPNSLLGRVGMAEKEFFSSPDDYFELSLEHNPILPDVQYRDTLSDLMFNEIGWISQGLQLF